MILTRKAPVLPFQGQSQQLHLDRGERRLRRITGWLLLCSLLAGEFGAPWDGIWHGAVGRDWFWTPPHILIYSAVASGGLVALTMVLLETLRYYRHCPGVDDHSTICVLRVFHAPLGYVVTGIGGLAALIAAPFDNYWHELYGIDLTLWSPFHIMGTTGSFIGMLGVVYVLASEAATARQSEESQKHLLGLGLLEWGTLLAIAGLLRLILSGFLLFPTIELGPVVIPTQLFPVVVCGCFCLISVTCMARRPGSATLLTAWLCLISFATELFVPWAVRTTVELQGLHYRHPGSVPQFSANMALLPLFLLPSALIIDGIAVILQRRKQTIRGQLRRMWLLGLLITIPQCVLVPCLVMATWNPVAAFLTMPTGVLSPMFQLSIVLATPPLLLALGVFGTWWGANFGDIWYWNRS